jgi:AraC family transcriptional regulator
MENRTATCEASAHMPAEVIQTLTSHALQAAPISLTRTRSTQPNSGFTEPYATEAAYLVVMQLQPFSEQDLWVDGKGAPHIPFQAGSLIIYDLERSWVANLRGAFDCLQFYVPQVTLDDMAEDLGAQRAGRLSCPPHLSVLDPTVHALGQALLPALAHPEQVSRLFVDHVALALHAHLAHTYGSLLPPRVRGQLAPWQARRAIDMLTEHLDGALSLAELASACGLSRSHFSKAFTQTTGLPPHRWLMRARVDRAKEHLRQSDLPLSQIAAVCGFADQSHFTRVFTRLVGAGPATWRRLQ